MSDRVKPFVPLILFSTSLVLLTVSFGFGFAFLFSLILIFSYFYLGFGRVEDASQSYEVAPAKPGHGAPRFKPGFKEIVPHPDEATTLYESFQHGVKVNPNGNCLGFRPADGQPFKWETYTQISKRLHDISSAFQNVLNLQPGETIGIYSKNRIEWILAAEACNVASLVSVAIYDTLGVENRAFVVQQSEIKAIFVGSELVKNVFDLAGECPDLKTVILLDNDDKGFKDQAKAVGLTLFTFKEFEALGKENPAPARPPKPDDLAILMYTSGTTSRPKGVMITHANLMATVGGIIHEIEITKDDRLLSYLPLAHILERAAETSFYYCGGAVGFFQGDIRKVTSDVLELKPTIYAGVPKVFQRVLGAIKAKLDSPKASIPFNIAFAIKKKCIETDFPLIPQLLDRIVFNKVKGALGGCVRVVVSGGAPLAGDCNEFLRIALGCPVIQGYGLTETCGGTSINSRYHHNPYEKVGSPIICNHVKLFDSGKYTSLSNPPEGEVCVHGPNITKGYYKMPDKTAEDFRVEEDGKVWFHTGDVGRWNADGTLSIIGRVKDIFKLDTGEYISPERLENIYADSSYVANIFIYGDSKRSYIVGTVVPEVGAALRWAKENGVAVPDHVPGSIVVPDSLCKNANFQKAIVADFAAIAKKAGLNNYEFLSYIHLSHQPWLPESGLVTSALKNKRADLFEHYGASLLALYN
jgi:long-chain acyl-CoA synthetase